MFEGILELRPWSKSTQSYCAQGSEYFVLIQSDGEELVIRNDSEQNLAPFDGKTVKIQGELETKTIKPSQNPFEQRIVMPKFQPILEQEQAETTQEEETLQYAVSSQPAMSQMPEEVAFTCTVLAVKQIQ